MKNLPIGVQNIKNIMEGNYVYVDKTEYIYKLMTNKYYFLSRPRRFGKSLLISTMKAIFSGNKELFKDCWIYDKIKWEKHPVIHIDFSSITHYVDINDFQDNIIGLLADIGKEYNVELTKDRPKERLIELTEKLNKKYGKVVILVDEYDKPIVDYVDNIEKANENKEFLGSFYETIKSLDGYLKFVFITGVTKFTKVSIFSKLNNLIDITIDTEFNDICGYTQNELEYYFSEYIEDLYKSKKKSRDDLLKKIKYWYNGYNWSGENTLYNPFGILSFFRSKIFKNYWFQTATPTFLIKLIIEKKVPVEKFEVYKTGETLFESYDMENIHPGALLFQTGYLTIKKIKGRIYLLGYPNFEVKESFLTHILAAYNGIQAPDIQPLYLEMVDYLKQEDIKNFQKSLISIFAGIPSFIQLEHEYYYHSLSYMVMALLGAKVNLEDNTDKGRIDGVIEFEKLIYIIEFKLDKATDALKQIEDKKYYEKFLNTGKKIILLGVGGFREKRIEVLYKNI